MTETQWWAYLQTLMGGENQQDAAKRVGISKSNFTRWKAGSKADPEFVVKIARAYGTNVLQALVAAEFLTEEEANLTTIAVGGPSLDDATNDELVAEVADRLREAGGATVHQLPATATNWRDVPPDRLAARESDPREQGPDDEW